MIKIESSPVGWLVDWQTDGRIWRTRTQHVIVYRWLGALRSAISCSALQFGFFSFWLSRSSLCVCCAPMPFDLSFCFRFRWLSITFIRLRYRQANSSLSLALCLPVHVRVCVLVLSFEKCMNYRTLQNNRRLWRWIAIDWRLNYQQCILFCTFVKISNEIQSR